MGSPRARLRYKRGDDDGYGEVLAAFPQADAWGRHPWGVWRDGKVRVLQRGRHFNAESAAGMRSTVYARIPGFDRRYQQPNDVEAAASTYKRLERAAGRSQQLEIALSES